jgi:hypothetical protein
MAKNRGGTYPVETLVLTCKTNPPQIARNHRIISVLLRFIPYYLIRKGAEIEVSGRSVMSRFPDLIVLTEATRSAMPPDKRALSGGCASAGWRRLPG